MNKNLLFVLVIIAVVVLGIWFSGSSSNSTPASTSTSTEMAAPQALKQETQEKAAVKAPSVKAPTKGVPNSTTYKSLLTQTGSYQCDYTAVDAKGQSTNVIYLYGGKMRGEFRTTSPGESTANLFVYDGQYLYQWKEGMSVGTRTLLTSLSQLPLIIPKDLTSGAIIGNSYTSVGWQCHTWLTNKALLSPPSYVTFN